ncbi:hypothetical protein ACWPMX_01600 [Tsuneonella sp. HG094]
MLYIKFAGALALAVAAVVATPSLADDPNDPTMRSAAARARDAAIIRKLNQDQLRHVQQRDAKYAAGNTASRDWAARENARRMAAWRHAVKMCESGQHQYCAR